jgi:hypothetical protein
MDEYVKFTLSPIPAILAVSVAMRPTLSDREHPSKVPWVIEKEARQRGDE